MRSVSMELVIEEAAVAIKVVSVNGKRMPKAIYNQLPRRSLLSEHDCTVQGRPWGIVLESKCCHDVDRFSHWHVLHERDGELAVWDAVPNSTAAGHEGPYEPSSGIDREFVNACALETHRGETDFFEGNLFDFIRGDRIVLTIRGVAVPVTCSRAVVALQDARKKHADVAIWNKGRPSDVPCRATELAEGTLKAAVDVLAELCGRRGRNAQELFDDLLEDVLRIKQCRVNFAAAQEMVRRLPQLFLGA